MRSLLRCGFGLSLSLPIWATVSHAQPPAPLPSGGATNVVVSRPAPAPPAPPATLTIGSWNIEHLGSPALRSGPARGVAQTPGDLAAYIRSSNVSVLALCEIDDSPALATSTGIASPPSPANPSGITFTPVPSNRTLNAVAGLLGPSWRVVLLPKRPGSSRVQHVAVLWDSSRAAMVGSYTVPPGQLVDAGSPGNEWERGLTAVQFSCGQGLTDFAIIPIHAKSNVGGVGITAAQRGVEGRLLAGALPGISAALGGERDIVMAGDWNALHGVEAIVQAVLGQQPGWVDLNAGDVATRVVDRSPFDRILVPVGRPAFGQAASAFDTWKVGPGGHGVAQPDDARAFKVRLSDHLMVRTVITVGPDDDGPGVVVDNRPRFGAMAPGAKLGSGVVDAGSGGVGLPMPPVPGKALPVPR